MHQQRLCLFTYGALPRSYRILFGGLPAQRLELSLRLRPPIQPQKRGFAPALPDFIRRTSRAETGIIIVGGIARHCMPQLRLRPNPAHFIRGFAPALTNFIRRTPRAETGIIIVGEITRHDFKCLRSCMTTEASPHIKLQYEALPRPYRILSGGLLAHRQELLLLVELHDIACTN